MQRQKRKVSKTQSATEKGRKGGLSGRVAIGAAGVAAAAGAVAAGALLANRKNRDSVVKGARKAFASVGEIADTLTDEVEGRYTEVKNSLPMQRQSKSQTGRAGRMKN